MKHNGFKRNNDFGFKKNRNKFQEQKTKGSAVIVQNNNVDKALRKLKKKLQKENFFNELRSREFFETRSEKKRKEKAASTRRCIRKSEKIKESMV